MTSDDLQRAMDRLDRKMAGDGPVQKQVILLKLTDYLENMPDFAGSGSIPAPSPQRSWLAAVGALLKRLDKIGKGIHFDTNQNMLKDYRDFAINNIKGQMIDTIEEIKLELELGGRDEVGTVYKPGEVYQFYADLKEIIAGADKEIFLIDAYLTGQAFDEYFGAVRETALRLLTKQNATDLKVYADRHSKQNQTKIDIRKSKEIHDRLIIADRGDAWVIGGSLNQKGDKPTYLLPLTPGVAESAKSRS